MSFSAAHASVCVSFIGLLPLAHVHVMLRVSAHTHEYVCVFYYNYALYDYFSMFINIFLSH